MSRIVEGIAMVAGAIALGFLTMGLGAALSAGMFTFLTTTAEVLGLMGVSMTLSGIADAVQGSPGVQVAMRQPAMPWIIIYGRARVGGCIVYMSVTNDKSWLHMVVVHAAHPCHAINGYWLDGRQVFFSGGGQSGTADSNDHYDPSGNIYNFHGDVYIENRLGTETGEAFATLRSYDGQWPSTATLQGHCCSYIRCKYDQNMWPAGYPQIRVDIAGKSNIYDPRDGTFKYTENAALCVNDVFLNPDYGLQCDINTEIDVTQLIAAANLCDESVPLANGSSEPRYTCNGSFDTSQAPGTIIQNMLTACAGRATCTGGLWRIYPAGWVGPTLQLGDDDVIAPIKYAPKRKYRDLYNAVKGRFICPSYPYVQYGPGYPNNQKVSGIFDGQWQSCDIPYYAQDQLHQYASDANLAADNNTRLWLDTQFPFTISVAAAQRLAKILLLRNRQQGTGTLALKLGAAQASSLDVIQLTHSRFNWTNKNFEVSAFRFQHQDTSGDSKSSSSTKTLYVEMDVQETDPSVYTWLTSEELSIEDNPSPVSPGVAQVSQAILKPISSANLNSAIVGGASPLSASDEGSSAGIAIAAFALQFGFGVVSYNSGAIHGLAYSTRYFVYANDPGLRGGSPTYLATTSMSTVTGDQNNVYIGTVVTPAQGGTSTGGTPGGGSGPTTGDGATGSLSMAVTGSYPSLTYTITWSSHAGGDVINVQQYYTVNSTGQQIGNTNLLASSSPSGSMDVTSYQNTAQQQSWSSHYQLVDVTTGLTLAGA